MALADIYQKATLVQIPSGYKAADAELYSVVPNNGDGDFTVSVDADATRVNKDGLIESVAANQPRLDYNFIDGVVQPDPHLLLEPTRRNLFFNSEDFTNASWNKTRTTITGNQATAPDGSNNADLLTGDGTGTSYIFDGVFIYSATYYVSIFVKNINGNNFTIQNFTQSGTAVFDLVNKSITSTSGTMSDAKIEEYPNNWYRVSSKITSTLGGANANIGFGVKNYNGEQFYIWGAQIEDNASGGSVSYLSSYIPTTAAVTRTVDWARKTSGLENVLNTSEGTLFFDLTVSSTDLMRISISDSSSGNDYILLDLNGGNFKPTVRSDSGYNSPTLKAATVGERIKIAFTYSSNQIRMTYDGNTPTTTSITYAPIDTFDLFNFSLFTGSTQNWQGKIYQAMYFPTALTNAELITLTS